MHRVVDTTAPYSQSIFVLSTDGVHLSTAHDQAKVLSSSQHSGFVEPDPRCWIVTPNGTHYEVLPLEIFVSGVGSTFF